MVGIELMRFRVFAVNDAEELIVDNQGHAAFGARLDEIGEIAWIIGQVINDDRFSRFCDETGNAAA